MNEPHNLYRQAIHTLLRGIAYEDYKGAEAAVVAGAVETLVKAYLADLDAFAEDDDDGEND